MSALLAISALALAAAAPDSHQAPPARDTSAPATVEQAFDKLHAAYRTGPVADRVQIKVLADAGIEHRSTVTVFLNRSANTTNKPTPSLRIDMGPLSLAVESNHFTAINKLERSTCFTADLPELTPANLWEVIPAIAIPEIELAFGQATKLPDLAPIATDVAWALAPQTTDATRPVFTLAGSSPQGHLSLVADASTGRLRHFTFEPAADLAKPASVHSVEMTIGPVEAGSPLKWELQSANRKPVASLQDLVPVRPALAVGDSLAEVTLMDADFVSYRIDQALDAAAHPTARVALVVFRLDADLPPTPGSTGQGVVESTAAAIAQAARAQGLTVSGVAFTSINESDPDRLAELSIRWAKLTATKFLWTSSRELSLEFRGRTPSLGLVLLEAGKVKAVSEIPERYSADTDAREIVRKALGSVSP